MAKIKFKASPTSVILRVKLMDSTSTTGAGKTGLTKDSPNLVISTIKIGESTPVVYSQNAGTIETIATLGTYAAPSANCCRFREVSADYHPGVYEIQLADARFASTTQLLISVHGATNLAQFDAEIDMNETDANIVAINGQSTSGNNATLKLKSLDIQNSAGSALIVKSTGGNGMGIDAAGHGTGHGANFQGGTAAGDGIRSTGGDTGAATAAGNALNLIGSTTSGAGTSSGQGSALKLTCQSQLGASVYARDTGSSSNGIDVASANNVGVAISGGSLFGTLRIVSSVGDAIVAVAAGNGNGINASGYGSGSGLKLNKGASGKDIDADEIDAVKAKTDQLAFTVANRVDAQVIGMQANTVTAAAIATGAIDADAIADNAIDAGAIAAGAITSAKFAAGAITSTVIADDAITAGKFDETTAFPLKQADTGATAVARTGADGDTLKTLSDEIDLIPTATEIDAQLTSSHGSGSWVDSGPCISAQGVRDAMKLAPSAGAPAAGSVDDHLDNINGDTDTVVAKLPTNYIMGSSVQSNKDDEIDAIKAKTDNLQFNGALDVKATLDGEAVIISGTKQTLDALHDISAAQVNAEVDTALADINLNHLLKDAAVVGDVANGSVIARLASKAITPNFGSYDNTTDSLEALADAEAGGITKQDVADAMLLAPVGTAANGSVIDRFNDAESTLNNIHDNTEAIGIQTAAIQAVTDNLPNDGTLSDIDTGIDSIKAKLPTAYIAGSSTPNSIDDEIAAILAKLPPAGTIFSLNDIIDGVPASTLLTNLLSMANGRFVVDEPVPGKVTFYKQNNTTPAFVIRLTEKERNRE